MMDHLQDFSSLHNPTGQEGGPIHKMVLFI